MFYWGFHNFSMLWRRKIEIGKFYQQYCSLWGSCNISIISISTIKKDLKFCLTGEIEVTLSAVIVWSIHLIVFIRNLHSLILILFKNGLNSWIHYYNIQHPLKRGLWKCFCTLRVFIMKVHFLSICKIVLWCFVITFPVYHKSQQTNKNIF